MPPRSRLLPIALALSGALHLAGVAWLAPHKATAAEAVTPSAEAMPPDSWAGETLDVEVSPVAEAPAPPTPAAPEPAPAQPAPAAPAPGPAATAEPKRAASPAPEGQAPAPRPRKKRAKAAGIGDGGDRRPAPGNPDKKPVDDRQGRGKGVDASPQPSASASAAGPGFGAQGASQVRHLGRAIARAIAPANHGDAGWASLPRGEIGPIEVELTLDETGRISGHEVKTVGAPTMLVSLVTRSLALLRGGFFSSNGVDASPGKHLFRLSARLSDEAPSDVQGGMAELSFAYADGKGRSSFVQGSGRRVEVSIAEVARDDGRRRGR